MEQFAGIEFELPPFAQKLIARGEALGEARGALRAKREVVLKLVARVGLALSPEQRARIDACEDLGQLDRWLDQALSARTADELFA